MREWNKWRNVYMEKVKVEYKDGFCLFGELVDKTGAGVWIKTNTETSFISYDLIRVIRKDPRSL